MHDKILNCLMADKTVDEISWRQVHMEEGSTLYIRSLNALIRHEPTTVCTQCILNHKIDEAITDNNLLCMKLIVPSGNCGFVRATLDD